MAGTPSFRQGDTEASIDQGNQWMRSQPWYQAQLAQWGQRPDNVHLSKEQGRQMLALAQANGAQVDEGDLEIDPGGNFNPKGHKLRTGLIIAGLAAGGALAAPAIAGALGGSAALGGGSTLAANLGAASALPTMAGAGTAAAAAGTAGGWGALASKVAPFASRALSSMSQADAQNRGVALDATLEQDRLRLAGAQDQRVGESDAWKKIAQAGYVKNWQPPTAAFSPYTKAIAAPTDVQKTAAQAYEDEMLKRLQSGKAGFQPTDISSFITPARSERLAGYVGAGLSAFDALRR